MRDAQSQSDLHPARRHDHGCVHTLPLLGVSAAERSGCSMSERWLPVVGWEGLYHISTQGRVWSEVTQRYLKPWLVNGVKLQVELCSPRRHRYIHDLMLEAFVGPRPEGLIGCHWNDIGTDNRIENLRWDTHSANQIDSVRNGNHREARKTHCPKRHEYDSKNTRIYKGKRFCRKCHNIATIEQKRQKRNAVQK